MKRHLLIIPLIVLLTSCTTMTPERIQMLVDLAAQAAQVGLQIWLQTHQDQKASVSLRISEIAALVKAGNTNPAAYVEMLDKLPTSQLASDSGQLMWSGASSTGYLPARIFVWDGELQKSVPITGNNVVPVMKGALRGMRMAVAETPPKLPVMHQKPMETNVALTDAQLDAQFEEVKVRLASHAVDYVVERKDSTGWCAIVLLTNCPAGEWRIKRK